jgi:hypothetical protein
VTGPNVHVNPSFDSGLTGWNAALGGASTITASGGKATFTRAGGSTNLSQNVLVIGAPYLFEVQVSEIVGGTFYFGANFSGQVRIISTPGKYSLIVPSVGAISSMLVKNNDGIAVVEWASARRMDIGMSKVSLTLRDYDGDKKRTSLELGPVTDGTSYVTRQAAAAAIRDAVNAVAGNIAAYEFAAISTEPNDTNTASPVYQTHVRWIVELFDSVTGDGPYAFDIPTADLGNGDLFLPASQEHNPAAAEWIALKAALNGIAINPRTGSTMTVGRIYLEE